MRVHIGAEKQGQESAGWEEATWLTDDFLMGRWRPGGHGSILSHQKENRDHTRTLCPQRMPLGDEGQTPTSSVLQGTPRKH